MIRGVAALDQDSYLGAIARARGQEIADSGYIVIQSVSDWAARYEYYCRPEGVENIASRPYVAGVAEEIAQAVLEEWMQDTNLRSNILNPIFDTTGVGVVISEEGVVYVVQEFC